MFEVKITMIGPMASGKTRLAQKLEKFLKEDAGLLPGQAKFHIVEYTGQDAGVDRRNVRETKFDV